MTTERMVAGLRCSEVLERLSDFVDGTLSPEEVTQVRAHLAGCDWCERFSGRFGDVVKSLREQLKAPDAADPALLEQAMGKLRE